jgi:hypothetical protein
MQINETDLGQVDLVRSRGTGELLGVSSHTAFGRDEIEGLLAGAGGGDDRP